jgi:hypothetical protein
MTDAAPVRKRILFGDMGCTLASRSSPPALSAESAYEYEAHRSAVSGWRAGDATSWLDYHRATLAMKCSGLSPEQLREAAIPPSALSLLGLVRHLADVERSWLRRTIAGEAAPPIYYSEQKRRLGGTAQKRGCCAVSLWVARLDVDR